MGRNRESRTGIAVLAFIVASATAQFNSPADLRGDCADKTDGIYPTDHCSTYFLECSGGRTTKQNCSAGLWFNPQSSQCDYRENIVSCQDALSCDKRKDGVYGEGCSAMFWYCSGGQLQHSTCPNGTYFNVDVNKCDFRDRIRACGSAPHSDSPSRTDSPRLAAVDITRESPTSVATEQSRPTVRDTTEVPYGQTYPTYAPRQRISGTVSKTPLAESTAGTSCAGKEDGSHGTEECSDHYVLCWAGTGQVMKCQQGLMFNEATGQCDYPLNVSGCNGNPSVSLDSTTSSLYGGTAPVVSAVPSTVSLPIPRQPVDFDCSTRSDGVYGSCSRHYFSCVAGVAYTSNCAHGLVYNSHKRQCDYKENCESTSPSVSADVPTTVIPVVTSIGTPIDFDCSTRPDGMYSRGCVAEFYHCSSGVVYLKKCPEGLVFDDHTRACDYPEICSAPSTTAAHDSAYSRVPTTVIPTAAAHAVFDCSSRVDGMYSDGCVSDYFSCASGVAYPSRCPDGLVFDAISHRCEYSHSCGQPRPMEQDTTVYVQSQPSSDSTANNQQTSPLAIDCSTRSDGMYGDACSNVFIQCSSGVAYTQKCPDGLVFHLKTAICDYPEKCSKQEDAVEVPVVVSPATQSVQHVKPTLTPSLIDCVNRSDGMYSSGCSPTFVQCVNGMAFNELCQEGLVFDQESGRCDYPDKCGVPSEETISADPSVPSTSSTPYKPSIAKETTTPKRDEPTGIVIDCTTLTDGSYSSGCTHTFVQCANGNAVPLECQAGLVFDKRVNQCVWPESCSSEVVSSLPTVSLPTRPLDVPSTVYDMKEEKDTRVPLMKDEGGSVCTGTGRRAMGKCSSGFVQCIGGKLVARRCPGQSLFDDKIGLCVYDMEECEMDVDMEQDNEHETTVVASDATQQDSSTGYNRQEVHTGPSYTEQTTQQTVYPQYSQSTHQSIPQQQYQEQYYHNGYQTQYPTQSQSGYQTGYQAAPVQEYQSGYVQDGQYQSVPVSPVYSSLGDSSLPSQPLSPECEIGSFRRVSACSVSFDACSPTARQWIKRLCGKSHRFDSSANKCRPIFEVRECDEPMSSYVPPPVQLETPAIYSEPASSLEYGIPLSGRNYEEKHVVDPFKGGFQSGRMGSNPFVAIGNTGSFYTEDGLRWVGSAWSEGGKRRRGGGGGRIHHKHGDDSSDYVIVSGNPFGWGREREDRVMNDEWKGRRAQNGHVRSTLTAANGIRVRNVVDNFKGRVSHYDTPLGAVNPFAVRRADGHRRRGRKSCRRDKHGRREDWDCEEKNEREEEVERHGDIEDEEKDKMESVEEPTVDTERPMESEVVEKELEDDGEENEENEETETDPEMMPESMDNEVKEEEKTVESEEKKDETGVDEEKEEGSVDVEETGDGQTEETGETDGVNEEEKKEESEKTDDGEKELTEETEDTTTMNGPVEEEEDDEESEDGSIEGEETEEERAQSENGVAENAVEEVNEDDVEREFEDGKSVSGVESKTDDVETPEGLEEGEKNEVKEEDETDSEKNEEEKESIESEEEMEKEEEEKEEGEKTDETGDVPAQNGESEESSVDEEGKREEEEKEETGDAMDNGNLEGEEKEVKEEDESTESIEEPIKTEENGEHTEETGVTVDRPDETVDEKIEEEPELIEPEDDTDETKDSKETTVDVETPESIDEPVDEKEETGDRTDETMEQTVNGEEEKTETDPEELPNAIEKEETEESEETAQDGEDEESDDESIEGEETTDGKNVEERTESETEVAENAAEELNEDDVKKEFDGESESGVESKTDDVETPEALEEGEKNEVKEGDGNGNIEMRFEPNGEQTEKVESAEDYAVMDPESVDGEEREEGAVKEDKEENGEETEEHPHDNEDEMEEEEEEGGGEKVDENEDNSAVNGDNEDTETEQDTNSRRRRRSVAYDPSVSTQSPVVRRLSLPRSSRLHRSRFSRLCVSSTPGQTISIGQCRQDFVYCKSVRRPVVAACPVGDLFDAVMSTCVPTEICGAERTKMETPSVTPTSVPTSSSHEREGERPTMPVLTTTTRVPEKTPIVVDDECSSLADGAYPLSDCSGRYFVCSASVKNLYDCPSHLVYHKKSDSCEWPVNVPACNGGAAADTTSVPATDTTENGYTGHSVNRDALATTVSPMHVHFDCIKDGGFAIDCKGGFVMCSNGLASFMKCSLGLVFDESSQSCQYPAHVDSCGLMPVSSLDVPTTVSPVYTPSTPSTPSTTVVPARAVEILVTTPVDKDACSRVSSGLEGATRVCASSFVICQEGLVTAVMNCPEGTFFDEKIKNCGYREIACGGGWSGEAHGVESPVEKDVPTVSPVSESDEYGRRASRPYRPSMPVVVEKIEKEEVVKREERPVVIPSTVEVAKGATCDWKGVAPSGVCSAQFIICSNGRPEEFDCSIGLVFSPSTSACEYPEFVSGCPQFKETSPLSPSSPSPVSTTSSVSDAVVVDESASEYSRVDSPSTTTMRPFVVKTGDHTSTKFEATGEHCTFLADQPSFPLNYCSMTYAVCTAQGMAYRTNCTFGFLFDSVLRRCVPSEHCGQPYLKEIAGASPSSSSLHSLTGFSTDSRCVGVKDGSLKATALCSGQYIRCEKESVVLQTCAGVGRVFSPLTGRCVQQVQMAECSSSPRGLTPPITRPKTVTPYVPSVDASSSVSLPTVVPSPSHRGARIRGGLTVPSPTRFDARSFCTTKHSDGLYRNPENCAGIVQCFGGEAFSYPSCAEGLFFNEVDGQCDYASNVPDCASQPDPVALNDSSASCKGQPHGAHLADDSDCSIYYRCVWGSLEKLVCPEGTVFNPRLSVCDYPSEVPHCQKQ